MRRTRSGYPAPLILEATAWYAFMMNAEREVAFTKDAPDDVQCWKARRTAAVVLSIAKGEIPCS